MTMTEWNGIKVGSIYRMTGKGSRGAPRITVTALTGHGCIQRGVPMECTVTVSETGTPWDAELELTYDHYEHDGVQVVDTRSPGLGSRSGDVSEYEAVLPWRYVEVE